MVSQSVGIGGWLGLLAFGLCAGLLRGIVDLLNGMSDFSTAWSTNSAARGPLALVFALMLACLAANAWAVVALFKKQKSFRQAYLLLWLLTLVVPLSMFVMLAVPGITSEMVVREADVGGSIGAFFGMAVWFWYVSVSMRVRNTLVN